MIDKERINPEWINQVSKDNRKADKILIEKVIRALQLLEGLCIHNIPFVFKGGTALMLHLKSSKRLSIDIDIIMPSDSRILEDIFTQIIIDQGFTKWAAQKRSSNSRINKEHYKFYYTPIHKSNKIEEHILLDILFETTSYTNIIKLPIESPFIPQIDQPILVDIPCLEDLLGDKLTAFAPNTTGIPYFKGETSMSMEIIKQLYDIGKLFDACDNLNIIKTTFKNFAITELRYRELIGLSAEDVLIDIYNTSLCIVSRGSDGEGNFDQLQQGIRRVSSFIFSESFHLEKAITLASKAAYIATLVKTNANKIEKFENPMLIKDWQIGEPMNSKLNKLKKTNPEAFFYWYKIYEQIMKTSQACN